MPPETGADPFATQRYLAESSARLSLKNRVLERLLGLYSDPPAPARLQEDLLDIAMEAAPCEASSLFLAARKGALVLAAARGRVRDQVKGLRLKPGQGIAGACLRDRRTIAVTNVAKDSRHEAQVDKALGFQTRSLLAVPLFRRQAPVGVLELINRQGTGEFQRHEIELLERIARAAGDLLHRAGEKR